MFRITNDFEMTGKPVKVQHLGHYKKLSRIFFCGPGMPQSAKAILQGLRNMPIKKGLSFKVGPVAYKIIEVSSEGFPKISLANLDVRESTEGENFYGVYYNPDSLTLYLGVEIPDYFGLLQDITYVVKELGFEIKDIRVQHKRLKGKSLIELSCPFSLTSDLTLEKIFTQFKDTFLKRIENYRAISQEGEKLFFTYQDLVKSIGRFLNNFPQIGNLPRMNTETIERIFINNPNLSELFIKYLRIKFDKVFSDYYGLNIDDLKSIVTQIKSEIEMIVDPQDKIVAEMMFRFFISVEKTNIFDPNRNPELVVFKLNDKVVQELASHFNISYPTDITYIYAPKTGSFALGARFGGEVGKGGDRYYPTTYAPGRLNYETISRQSLEETLRLAWTQEVKNILWGCYVNGLKTVLVAAPPVKEDTLDAIYAALHERRKMRAFSIIRDALWELTGEKIDQTVTKILKADDKKSAEELLFRLVQLETLVLLSEGENYLKNLGDKRPGPDMRMSPPQMDFLTVVAQHMEVDNWSSIYTGKSQDFGGFPHKKLRVTAIGVFENMLISLEQLGIDPREREVTVTIQGFGDVGGGLAYLLLEKQEDIKLTAISDLTGMLVYPEGFSSHADVKEEILRLIREEKTLDQFSKDLLREGVEFKGPDRIDEILTLPSTIFIPAAGSNVITDENVEEVLSSHELVFEAANIPFTVSAARKFDSLKGRRILDAFVNGGGVLTSTNEILTLQALGLEEFKTNHEQLEVDNEKVIKDIARENAQYAWKEFNRLEGEVLIPKLVQIIGQAMIRIKSIIKVSSPIFAQEGIYEFLFNSLFLTILEKVDKDEIIERLGPSIARESIAAQLARKIVFAHEYDWFEKIEENKKNNVILKEAITIIAKRNEQEN